MHQDWMCQNWKVSRSERFHSENPNVGKRQNHIARLLMFFQPCWPTRDHIGKPTRNSNPVMTSSADDAEGLSDHRFHAPPAYTSQLLTLHQHRPNNQYRMASQITEVMQCWAPLQVLTELNTAWLQWLYKNWHFQVDKSLSPFLLYPPSVWREVKGLSELLLFLLLLLLLLLCL